MLKDQKVPRHKPGDQVTEQHIQDNISEIASDINSHDIPRSPKQYFTLILLSSLLIICLGIFTLLGIVYVRFVHQHYGSAIIATQYMQDIKDHNPNAAYTYLDSGATIRGKRYTKLQFIQLIQLTQQKRGALTGTNMIDLKESGNNAKITLEIMRKANRKYRVILLLKKEGPAWKITQVSDV
jgi:hypothetical protein